MTVEWTYTRPNYMNVNTPEANFPLFHKVVVQNKYNTDYYKKSDSTLISTTTIK